MNTVRLVQVEPKVEVEIDGSVFVMTVEEADTLRDELTEAIDEAHGG